MEEKVHRGRRLQLKEQRFSLKKDENLFNSCGKTQNSKESVGGKQGLRDPANRGFRKKEKEGKDVEIKY